MTDDRTPDPVDELASAFLDGDLDADTRARAEASPEVMARVEEFRSLRSRLSEPVAAADTTRETAIAAALAEFDVLFATVPAAAAAAAHVVAPPTVVPIRRNRWPRVLSAAAAVAAVGVAGVVVAGNLHSNSTAATSAPHTTEVALPSAGGADSAGSPPRTSPPANGSTTGSKNVTSTIGSIGGPATSTIEVDEPSQLLTVSDQYDGTFSTDPTIATTVAGGSGGVSAAEGSTAPQVPTSTTAGDTQSSSGNRPTLACGLGAHQIVIAQISYRGTLAWAVRDTVTGVVEAVDPACHVLATATP